MASIVVGCLLLGFIFGRVIVCPEQVNCNLIKNIPDCICEAHYCDECICPELNCTEEIVNEILEVRQKEEILKEIIEKKHGVD